MQTFKTVTDFFGGQIKNFLQFWRNTDEYKITLLDTFHSPAELIFSNFNKLQNVQMALVSQVLAKMIVQFRNLLLKGFSFQVRTVNDGDGFSRTYRS